MVLNISSAHIADLPPGTVYELLRPRVDVFIVEQQAAYAELDGRDLEADALQLWAQEDDTIVATLRLLSDDAAWRIGRVATVSAWWGQGIAAQLMSTAIDTATDRDASLPIVLDAQEHLAGWYGRFGFAVSGERYEEDGIPHLPMTRRGSTRSAGAP